MRRMQKSVGRKAHRPKIKLGLPDLVKLKQRFSTACTHPSRSTAIDIPSMNSSAGIVPNPAYPSTRPSSRATKFIKHAHWIDHGFVG